MRKIWLGLFLLLLFFPQGLKAETWVVSSYPLYKIFQEIFPEKKLYLLQSPKGEFHFSEPTPKEWELIKRAEFIILVGTEPFAEKIFRFSSEEKVFSLRDRGESLPDPHLWFDLARVERKLKALLSKKALQSSPDYKKWQERGERFLKELSALRAEYASLSSCKGKEVYVIGHRVFYYLFKETKVKEITLIAGHHHGEITPQKLVNFLKEAKKKGLPGVLLTEREFLRYKGLFEKEGLKVREAFSGDRDAQGTFLEMLRQNLKVLQELLQC